MPDTRQDVRVDSGSDVTGEMFQHVDWTFPDGQFPARLGAVVQQTVLSGDMPALVVLHAEDGSWAVGDGVNDPKLPGASVATHMAHALALNSSVPGWRTFPRVGRLTEPRQAIRGSGTAMSGPARSALVPIAGTGPRGRPIPLTPTVIRRWP
jgi:hypothetical protein